MNPLLKRLKQHRNKFSDLDNLPISVITIVPFALHILVTICTIEYFCVARDRTITQNAVTTSSIKSDRVFSRLDNYLDDSSSVPQKLNPSSIENLNNFLQQLRSDIPGLTEVVIQEKDGSIVTELSRARLQADLDPYSQLDSKLDRSIVEKKIVRQIPVDDNRDWLVTVAMQTPVSSINNVRSPNQIRLQYLSYLLPTTLLGIAACIWLKRSLNSAGATTPIQNIASEKSDREDNSAISASIALSQLQKEFKSAISHLEEERIGTRFGEGLVLEDTSKGSTNSSTDYRPATDYHTTSHLAEGIARSKQLNNYVKSSLVADMSHELRSPLNAILGFAQILLQESTIERSQQENLAIINSSGEKLLLIINELVDLSKIEVDRFSLEHHNFDLHGWLDNLEQILKIQNCEQLKFSLIREPNVPQYICLDETRLRQILNNLIKYCLGSSPSQSQIKLEISATFSLLDLVTTPYYYDLCFEIENSNLVISDEELAGLFDPSVGARQQWQSFIGSSLSLPISRKLAQLMEGDISVIRNEGEGTIFRLNVRAQSAIKSDLSFKPPTERNVIGLEPDQLDYRILVVDDSKTNRKYMVHVLEKVGFQVEEAVNGREAVDVWLRWQPHMIWMDLRMPVMNGYEAIDRIKSHPSIQCPKIVLLTASTIEKERSQFTAPKYDDCVYKPYKDHTIFEKIAQHLGVRYIYDTIQPKKATLESTADIKVMSPEWLDRAEQAAASLDADLLTTLLQQIPTEHSDLKQVLQKQIDNFDFEKIINSIEQSKTNR